MKTRIETNGTARRGAALVYAAIVATLLAALAVGMLAMNLGTVRMRASDRREQKAFYVAEAGLSDAFMQVTEGLLDLEPGVSVSLGSPDAPIELGTSAYWVDIEGLDSRSYSLAATALDDGTQERLELVLSEAPTGFFQFAAFGADGVVLDSNAFIDSYDSALGTYDSQVKGGNAFARENGHVGSNDDILLKSNTDVHGDCIPGPGHVVDDSAPRVYVSGSTEPAEEDFPIPPITVPSFPSSGTLVGNDEVVLGPGDVHYDSILMNGGSKLRIIGPARIVADDFKMKSNTQLSFETDNGPVELIAPGDFVLESNSEVLTSSDSAVDVTLLLGGNNTTKRPPDDVELGSNADFVGAIYAPNAKFRLASNFTIYGSIMCGFLDLSSFGEIHFDEALLYDGFGSSDEYEATLWRPLPHQ
jgi:hypothetical protein